MGAGLSLFVVGVPLLAFPVALIWGFRRMLWAVLIAVALLLIGPPLGFGVMALFYGEPPVQTAVGVFKLLSQAVLAIGGWMVFWAMIYGGVGAAIRWGWMRWRAA